jgi:hypothetical protein
VCGRGRGKRGKEGCPPQSSISKAAGRSRWHGFLCCVAHGSYLSLFPVRLPLHFPPPTFFPFLSFLFFSAPLSHHSCGGEGKGEEKRRGRGGAGGRERGKEQKSEKKECHHDTPCWCFSVLRVYLLALSKCGSGSSCQSLLEWWPRLCSHQTCVCTQRAKLSRKREASTDVTMNKTGCPKRMMCSSAWCSME